MDKTSDAKLENNGEDLLDLLKSSPSKEVISQAMQWIEFYPDHELAAKIVAESFRAFPRADTSRVAAQQLQKKPLNKIRPIVFAVIEGRKKQKLLEIIKERIKKEPNHDLWQRVAMYPPKYRTANADELAATYIDYADKTQAVMVSIACLFTKSKAVLESTYSWLKRVDNGAEYYGQTVSSLIRSCCWYHKKYHRRVSQFGRKWLNNNPSDKDSAFVYEALICTANNDNDEKNAVTWLRKNETTENAWRVMASLIDRRRNKVALETGKRLVRSTVIDRRATPLLLAILNFDGDEEIRELAKATYFANKDERLLSPLINLKADKELINAALKVLEVKDGYYKFMGEIVKTLLNVYPGNKKVIKSASAWLKSNPDQKESKAIKALLQDDSL